MTSKTPLQKLSRITALVLILGGLPLSLHFLNKKLSPERKLASEGGLSTLGSVHDNSDLSEASPEEFRKAFKYQVLKNAKRVSLPNGPGLNLGAFIMKNSLGTKVSVCELYPIVDIHFTADGMAVAGEAPQMLLRIPCLISADQNHIIAYAIPFEEIAKASLSQYEFPTSSPEASETGKVYFRNIPEAWPADWTWTGVTFHGKDPTQKLHINGYEIISVLGEPQILKLNSNE